MTALIGAVVVASLMGSLHCVGMCGGLVAAAAAGPRAQALYHAARLLAYATLGALAGSAGAAIDLAGGALGVQRAGIVFAGGAMVIWGCLGLLRAAGVRVPLLGRASASPRVARILRRLQGRPPLVRAAILGLVTALLPCGWLYAFVATAAGTGSALGGAALMAAFWAGTVPALAGLGVGVRWLTRHLGRHVATFTALLIVVAGLWTLVDRARLELEPAATSLTTPASVPTAAPCCAPPDDAGD